MHGGDNRKKCKKNKCYEFVVIKGVCYKHNPKKEVNSIKSIVKCINANI